MGISGRLKRWTGTYGLAAVATVVVSGVTAVGCGRKLGPVANDSSELQEIDVSSVIVRARGIDDAGVDELQRLRDLRTLDLEGGVRVRPQLVTEAGFLRLPRVVHEDFSVLLVACTQEVTDRAVEAIAEIDTLRILRLRRCGPFDTRGLEALAAANRLTDLSLEGCRQIDDGDIDVISRMTSLRVLHIAETGITPDGVRQLRRRLSLAKIDDDMTMWRANDPAPPGWSEDWVPREPERK